MSATPKRNPLVEPSPDKPNDTRPGRRPVQPPKPPPPKPK